MSETFGSWELESLIAVGGLGEIWRASRGEDSVALKRLHTHLARNAEARAQFKIEQQLTTQLPRHPHVIHAHDAGSVGDRPYVALELASGDDLRRAVAAGEPLAVPRVRAIVAGASDGASHLHRHGYVHGDLCPGNLIVGRTDHVTVIDLGIARPIGGAGVVRGTHAYMAPEQVRGEPWTTATDVFALGIVLWELATGARLFYRGPPWLTMAAVVEAEVPALADPELDAIARAALAKDPAQRIVTAAALAALLRS